MTHAKFRKWVRDTYLAGHYDVSRQTIWRWVSEGKLPSPKKLSAGVTRWDLTEIETHDAKESA